jgi:formate--tetrahydrofolate ligase
VNLLTDLQISRNTKLRPVGEVAGAVGIPEHALDLYGRFKSKVRTDYISQLPEKQNSRLVLVTGISPTPAGEGKTTTTIGLGDALNAAGRRTIICLREPSLGPCFGIKGGATGGGYAQVVPMEDINLHFTGDFHAITSANNLLAAMLDNHLFWGNAQQIDSRRISWRRALDMNDRSLRSIVSGLGGATNGSLRETGFDITVASEVMAVFCLASDLPDLQRRLGRIVIGQRQNGTPVTAGDVKADGAMAVLLREAFAPNLVQTLAGSPALVHGGPFANIAHGCNSVVATNLGLKLADIVVTEAGFGADLGAEKFFDIKCRSAGLTPACCVVVATIRALKMHGGVTKSALGQEDTAAVARGVSNLARHVENLRKFQVPVIVAVNHFDTDTESEFGVVRDEMAAHATQAVKCTHWGNGPAGAAELAQAVMATLDDNLPPWRLLYDDSLPLVDKIKMICADIYRADGATFTSPATRSLEMIQQTHGELPICVAKTPYSFSADPALLGAPKGYFIPVREVRLAAGAGFVVAICGDIMTMPGLPRSPAAESIRLDADGQITGLF